MSTSLYSISKFVIAIVFYTHGGILLYLFLKGSFGCVGIVVLHLLTIETFENEKNTLNPNYKHTHF